MQRLRAVLTLAALALAFVAIGECKFSRTQHILDNCKRILKCKQPGLITIDFDDNKPSYSSRCPYRRYMAIADAADKPKRWEWYCMCGVSQRPGSQCKPRCEKFCALTFPNMPKLPRRVTSAACGSSSHMCDCRAYER